MIKKYPKKYNLKDKQYHFIDTDMVSKDFFRVDLPDKFYVGKNSFSIKPTANLLKGSPIYIEILDSKLNNIYYEITDVITETNSRLITVEIYPDNPFGEITIYIAGVGKLNNTILWKHEIRFINQPTPAKPIFKNSPIVTIKEIRFPILTQDRSRLTSKTGNGRKLSVKSDQDKPVDTFKLNNPYAEQFPNYYIYDTIISSSIDSETNPIISITTTKSDVMTSKDILPINTFKYDVVYVTSSFFSSSMVGGKLEFNLQDYMSENYSQNISQVPNSLFVKNSMIYTSSIIDVLDNQRAKIYPNFDFFLQYQGINYLTVKELTNFTNFTASYFDSCITGSTTSAYQSFLYCEIKNLSPLSGQVQYVDISYKPYNFIGEPIPLNSVKVDAKDLFIDTTQLKTINNVTQFKRYGYPTYPFDVTNNWTSSIVGQISSSGFEFRDRTSNTGIVHLTHTKIYDSNSYIKLYCTSSVDFISVYNTPYELNFNYYIDNKSFDDSPIQLDVYLSGSSVNQINTKNNINIINDDSIGTYLGSVTNEQTTGYKKFEFITNESKQNKFYFIIRGGHWKLKDINIKPLHYEGFNTNFMYCLVPIDSRLTNDEILLNFKYKNSNQYSNIETNLYGLFFTGSTT